jgi:hypothetical protein
MEVLKQPLLATCISSFYDPKSNREHVSLPMCNNSCILLDFHLDGSAYVVFFHLYCTTLHKATHKRKTGEDDAGHSINETADHFRKQHICLTFLEIPILAFVSRSRDRIS